MRLNLRNQYFSQSRYNRYMLSTGNDLGRSKRLYLANIRLAQAFHPLLSQFEVILRNSINNELTNYFSDSNWIRTQKNGFMSHQSLGNKPYLKGQIINSERRMRRDRVPITSGKLIADQTLGFWVAYFSRPHYRILTGRPIHIFPNKPSIENRASIHRKLEKIRNFRNRVNHCEPLCFYGNTINCTEATQMKNMIFELTQWIDIRLIPFMNKIDNIDAKINHILTI